MVYEVLLLDTFDWNGFKGKLYFSRYNDMNPALIFKTEDEIPILTFTVNAYDFYREYPFGDNRLVAVSKGLESEGAVEALHEAGIISRPAFKVHSELGESVACELSDQVVDLLKAFGEYYV
ncbi:MAG TPA: hypothetical protein VHO03_02270 [Ignavibacteriales bacterium]|nr:hypothetical protein [Ignavibacteriales bacterium]